MNDLIRDLRLQLQTMRNVDMEVVSEIVASAYRDIVRQLFGDHAVRLYHPRTPGQLEATRLMFADGCFTAADQGGPIGAIFARKWGELGWFSSLAVRPQDQGRGVGMALARAAADALRESGCHTVGLETWPSSSPITAMYVRLGFQPVAATAQMIAPSDLSWPEPKGGRILLRDELSTDLDAVADAAADRICNKLVPGMSIRTEIADADSSPRKQSLWLVKADKIEGVGLFDASPDFDATAMYADLWVGVMDPDHADPRDFLALAGRAAAEGLRVGRTRLNVDVSTDYPESFKVLLDAGFRSTSQLLRFVDNLDHYAGDRDRAVFNVGRWAT